MLRKTAAVHKALGHPARLRILAMLRGGPLCVCQITAVLRLAPSTVSAHLAALKRAGFITERKEGRWVHYARGRDPAVQALVRQLDRDLINDPVAGNDAALLEELRKVPVEDLCQVDLDLAKLGIPAGQAGVVR